MRGMIIKYDNGEKHFYICPACSQPIGAELPDATMPVFYSELHARDCGWLKTANRIFCPPDKEYVWVCPICVTKPTTETEVGR